MNAINPPASLCIAIKEAQAVSAKTNNPLAAWARTHCDNLLYAFSVLRRGGAMSEYATEYLANKTLISATHPSAATPSLTSAQANHGNRDLFVADAHQQAAQEWARKSDAERSEWISKETFVKFSVMDAAGVITGRASREPQMSGSGHDATPGDAEQRAKATWANMSADDQSAWLDEKTFVKFSVIDANGQYRGRNGVAN
jgi:hypothetical protein